MGGFYHFFHCQELRHSLIDEDIKRDSNKKELDKLRQGYKQEKSFTVIAMWECKWWRLCKTTNDVKLPNRENFFYKQPLTKHQLLERTKK